jgi:hypothetical protein
MMRRNEASPTGGKQPVFVLGTARSGTSWCANLLAMHPDIAAAATAEHDGITGIHESHLFSHTRYCFPEQIACREFIARYKEEDYFKLTGLSPHTFCTDRTGHFTVYELFRTMMEDFADRKGASHWLEKTPKHTIYYDELIREFPDALFVITRRGFRETILSNVNKYPRKGASFPRQVVEKVFRYVSDRRAIKRLKGICPERIVEVRYERLLENTQAEVARLLRLLKLEQRELHSAFPTNSAYEPGKASKRRISALGWLGVYAAAALFWLVPFPIVRYLRTRRDKHSANRFPKYTFVPTPREWFEA